MTDIQDRIRKLLAVTKDRGATPAEMENAMTLASALMAKYNIEHIAEKTEVVKKQYDWITDKWHAWILNAVSRINGVTFSYSDIDVKIYGRPENIDGTWQMFSWLVIQIERAYKENLPKGLSQSIRANYRKTFKQAAAARVYHRCEEIIAQMRTKDDVAMKATGSRALVVAQTNDQLLHEAKEYLEGLGLKFKKSRGRTKVSTGYGTRAGVEAGDRIQIQRGVTETKKLGYQGGR